MSDEVKAPREAWLYCRGPGYWPDVYAKRLKSEIIPDLGLRYFVPSKNMWCEYQEEVHFVEHSRVVELEAERDATKESERLFREECERMHLLCSGLIKERDALLAQATAMANLLMRMPGTCGFSDGRPSELVRLADELITAWSKFLSERGGT